MAATKKTPEEMQEFLGTRLAAGIAIGLSFCSLILGIIAGICIALVNLPKDFIEHLLLGTVPFAPLLVHLWLVPL